MKNGFGHGRTGKTIILNQLATDIYAVLSVGIALADAHLDGGTYVSQKPYAGDESFRKDLMTVSNGIATTMKGCR